MNLRSRSRQDLAGSIRVVLMGQSGRMPQQKDDDKGGDDRGEASVGPQRAARIHGNSERGAQVEEGGKRAAVVGTCGTSAGAGKKNGTVVRLSMPEPGGGARRRAHGHGMWPDRRAMPIPGAGAGRHGEVVRARSLAPKAFHRRRRR